MRFWLSQIQGWTPFIANHQPNKMEGNQIGFPLHFLVYMISQEIVLAHLDDDFAFCMA